MSGISVVIPTRNAGDGLDKLLGALGRQTVRPDEILVIDSASEDGTPEIALRHSAVRVHRIPREAFNHGGTRDLAFSLTAGDTVVFLTQDAVPASAELLERLTFPLRKEKNVASYGRQIPKAEASPREKLVRAFNYPLESAEHSLADIAGKGIRTFFLSDVCAAYRRKEYEALGGFERDVLTNEDMFFAAKAIRAGYCIAYAADAAVFHSHDLTLAEQYRRNWLQGYEIERHRSLVGEASSAQAGLQMLRRVTGGLLRQGRLLSTAGLVLDCGARYLGSRAGSRAYRRTGDGKGEEG